MAKLRMREAAHQNCLEIFRNFAAALFAGNTAGLSAEWMNEFSLAYVLLRCAYIFPYAKSRVTDHYVTDLPEILQDAGYHTVMSGKCTAQEPNLSSNPTTEFYSSTFYIT
ncbi:hypothetical protein EHS25_004861 [Saitozyma podzolica]|uniref:Uncharacterized protein n=1 Tax=Saitozyma podzolica TaxID=1890683 RepID=A0A427Y3B7_9TREE|nr:hypothetical protein EHS25_004861 [Saitozyma podzolica]